MVPKHTKRVDSRYGYGYGASYVRISSWVVFGVLVAAQAARGLLEVSGPRYSPWHEMMDLPCVQMVSVLRVLTDSLLAPSTHKHNHHEFSSANYSATSTSADWTDACKTADRIVEALWHQKASGSAEPKCELTNTSSRIQPPLAPGEGGKPSPKIKNVVLVVLESFRWDVYPMNYSEKWIQSMTRKRDLTTFIDALPGKLVYTARPTSTYSLKSLLSIFCGYHPLPLDFNHEYELDFPGICLPLALQQHGFATSFFTSSTMKFDKQAELFDRFGFDTIFSFEHVQQRSNGTITQRSKNTYFGVPDNDILPDILEWTADKVARDTPFFLSIATIVSHHPFKTPKGYRPKVLKPGIPAHYLNTIAFTDEYLRSLMDKLRQVGVRDEETLYVFVGDHGMALGHCPPDETNKYECNKMGSNTNARQPLLEVPLIFYTTNPSYLAAPKVDPATAAPSALDIVPTVFDALRLTPPTTGTGTALQQHAGAHTEAAGFGTGAGMQLEGYSLLRPLDYVHDRMHFIAINPGSHAVVAVQHMNKLVLYSQASRVDVIDLNDNPMEATADIYSPSTIPNELVSWYCVSRHAVDLWKRRVFNMYGTVDNGKEEGWKCPLVA
jgi:hypothetical protein